MSFNPIVQLFGKKGAAQIADALNAVSVLGARILAGNPALQTAANQLTTDVQTGVSQLASAVDTGVGQLIASEMPVIEAALDGLLIKAGAAAAASTGGLAPVVAAGLTPVANDAVETIAAAIKSQVDGWALKAKASLTPAPAAPPAPPTNGG